MTFNFALNIAFNLTEKDKDLHVYFMDLQSTTSTSAFLKLLTDKVLELLIKKAWWKIRKKCTEAIMLEALDELVLQFSHA